jgi:DNA-directed RNA polymerase beta subunit
MSTKLLFNVLLPATGKSYDLWVPKELTVYEATQLISRLLSEAESRFFQVSGTNALYLRRTGEELRGDVYVGAMKFSNGTKLILV